MHILVQHEVEDFEVWKKVYDEDEPARAAAGFKEITLYQGLDNPNNVVAIFSNDDVEKAFNEIEGLMGLNFKSS